MPSSRFARFGCLAAVTILVGVGGLAAAGASADPLAELDVNGNLVDVHVDVGSDGRRTGNIIAGFDVSTLRGDALVSSGEIRLQVVRPGPR